MEALLFYGYEFLSSFIPFLVMFIILRKGYKKKALGIPHLYYMFVIFFALYIIGVFHFTSAGTFYNGFTYHLEVRQDQINLIPFFNDIDLAAYSLNILLFVPLGILVPLIWENMGRLVHILEIGFAFSSLIEMSQLLNNRRTDIDDLILNLIGAVIGFAVYKVWARCTNKKVQLRNVPTIELPVYIMIIFAGRFLLYNEIGFAKLLYGF